MKTAIWTVSIVVALVLVFALGRYSAQKTEATAPQLTQTEIDVATTLFEEDFMWYEQWGYQTDWGTIPVKFIRTSGGSVYMIAGGIKHSCYQDVMHFDIYIPDRSPLSKDRNYSFLLTPDQHRRGLDTVFVKIKKTL